MKICFVGLGSIGKRHFENLITYGAQHGFPLEVHALRSSHSQRPLPPSVVQHLSRQVADIGELDERYDAIFIANPTYLHYETLVQLGNRSRYFFLEKPVFDRLDVDLSAIPFTPDAVCYVAAPLRHCAVLQTLKRLVPPQDVYCARAMCSSYLPDWRPGVDYRKVYSAKKEEGGGVCIDLIHEWDYLTDFFGFPLESHLLTGTFSDLEITSEDLAVYIARYPDKLVELHLDYFGRETRRGIELFTKERTIFGDITNARITFSDSTPPIDCWEERNAMYENELAYFLSLVLQQAPRSMNSIDHAMRMMKLAQGEHA